MEIRGISDKKDIQPVIAHEISQLILGSDQNNPEKIVYYFAGKGLAKPIFILGGMGPLAGLKALESAISKHPERDIILFQNTQIPDRTAVILSHDSKKQHVVINFIKEKLEQVFKLLDENYERFKSYDTFNFIVSCNTCHYFLIDSLKALDSKLRDRLHFISIIKSAVVSAERMIMQNANTEILICMTDGSQSTKIYENELSDKNKANFKILSFGDNRDLMAAIYKGVKAGDKIATQKYGKAFFDFVLKKHPNISAIIAGCTEVPEVILEASMSLKALDNLRILSPVNEALGNLH